MEKPVKVYAEMYAICFGAFGGHLFYVRDRKRATIRLVCSCLIPLCFLYFLVIGFIDARRLSRMSDEEFARYCEGIERSSSDQPNETDDPATEEEVPPQDLADKYQILRDYKALMDDGAITAEEFDLIKQQISEGKYV